MLLSQAYHCENEWAKRLDHPLLKNIKLGEFVFYVVKIGKTYYAYKGEDMCV